MVSELGNQLLTPLSSTYTKIPVPQVFDLDLDLNDTVHSPCLYMQYIHGNTARERLAQELFSDWEINSILLSLYEQLTGIAVELSDCSFPQISSLYLQDRSMDFIVREDYETG